MYIDQHGEAPLRRAVSFLLGSAAGPGWLIVEAQSRSKNLKKARKSRKAIRFVIQGANPLSR